jgi:prepilin-type N-terminal cleavage/methylation domain-containing protein
MKNKYTQGFTLIELFVVITILAILITLGFSIWDKSNGTEEGDTPATSEETRDSGTKVTTGDFLTVTSRLVTAEHEGHSYIILQGEGRGALIHSPACECHGSLTLEAPEP